MSLTRDILKKYGGKNFSLDVLPRKPRATGGPVQKNKGYRLDLEKLLEKLHDLEKFPFEQFLPSGGVSLTAEDEFANNLVEHFVSELMNLDQLTRETFFIAGMGLGASRFLAEQTTLAPDSEIAMALASVSSSASLYLSTKPTMSPMVRLAAEFLSLIAQASQGDVPNTRTIMRRWQVSFNVAHLFTLFTHSLSSVSNNARVA